MSRERTRRHLGDIPSKGSGFFRFTSKVFLYLILGILALFVLLTVIFPKVIGASTYTVLSGSMSPGFEPGHLIGVKPTPITDLQVGDVITYQLESGKPTMVTHRIVGKSQTTGGEISFTTQGDANNVADKIPVQEAQIQGKLVYSVPYIGRVTNLLTPQTKAVVSTVLGIGIIAYGVTMFLPKGHRRARGARRANTAGVLVLAGALTFGPTLAQAQAAPDPQIPEIEVSQDGVHWNSQVAVVLFSDAGQIVPGQTLSAPIWIRNTTGHTISASVAGTWVPGADAAAPELDDPLWDYLDLSYGTDETATWEISEFAPQEVRDTTVQVTFSPQARGHQNSRATLILEVRAQEVSSHEEDSPIGAVPSEPLVETGFGLGPTTACIAGLVLVIGFGLYRVAASRSREDAH